MNNSILKNYPLYANDKSTDEQIQVKTKEVELLLQAENLISAENKTEVDIRKEFEILLKLSEKGNDIAIMKLYHLYRNYNLNDKNIPFDVMIKFLNVASENNNIEALNILGTIYQFGEETNKDINRSKVLYEKALSMGSKDSAFNLADIYRNEKNQKKSKEYFEIGLELTEMNKFLSLESIPKFTDKDLENKKYLILNNKIYDVGEYMKKHPGGKEVLQERFGQDATDDFYGIHSNKAKKILASLFLGFYDSV